MDDDDSLLAKVAASPARVPPRGPLVRTTRFELRRRLGSGSFGEVFEGRDRESGAAIAVKVLRATEPDRLFRFKREFRAVADLVHPNLVRLYELVEEDRQWYLAMELVEGIPFGEHVRRAPEQVRPCFAQLAHAIDALHRAGSLHRDIKPTNVLVERTGRVVLLDFGLAVALEAIAHTAIAGTPQYMPPEQMTGGALGPACDWYAFGVMLYEALAGAAPFAVPRQRLPEAKQRLPAEPSTLRDDVDEELERLCMRLLSPRPDERPSANEILTVLAAVDPDEAAASARESEPFAGRAPELAILRELFDGIDDSGAVAFIEGQAGIGKTSLVRAFEDAVAKEGAVVFAGRCHEAESVPFKGLDAVVDAISEHLRRRKPIETASVLPRHAHSLATMFPIMKRVEAFAEARNPRDARRGPVEMRRAALEALRELVLRLSDGAPVVVFVDDIQWGTADGLQLLFELLAPPTPPALFVIAYRAEAVGRTPALDRLLSGVTDDAAITSRRISLAPLSQEEVRQLLENESASGTSDAASMWRETGGHPFLLSRLLRGSAERSAETGLTRVLDDQFARLTESARNVLEIVSLSAASLTQEAACAAAGLPRWDPLVVDELRHAKLIRSLGRNPRASIEPYHDQVREHLALALGEERGRVLHRRLAEFLESDRRADAEAIAHHHASAQNAERAILWMCRAAEDAIESLAFARAAELHGRAATLATEADERIDLLVEQADALVLAGRRNDAARVCLEACEVARSRGLDRRVAELRALAGEHHMLGGDFEKGTALLREALANVGVTLPATTGIAMAETLNLQVDLFARGFAFTQTDERDVPAAALRRVDLELSAARSLAQTDIRAPWLSITALGHALDLGEPMRIQRALAIFGFVMAARLADHPMGDAVLTTGEMLARNLQDDTGLAWAILARGVVLLYRRRMKESAALLRDAERRFLMLRRPLWREAGIARIGLLTVGGSYGHDLPFAIEMSKKWIAEALEREDYWPVTWLRLMGTWVHLAGDDVASAREDLRLAREAWSSVEDEVFNAAAVIAELSLEIYADPNGAWLAVQRTDPIFRRLFASVLASPRISFFRMRAASALCALQAGQSTREETMQRVRESIDDITTFQIAEDTADVLRGHLAMLEGDPSRAASFFRAAADGFAAQEQRTYELLARWLGARAAGDVDDVFVDELRAIGISAPDRYALLFVGPLPPQPSP